MLTLITCVSSVSFHFSNILHSMKILTEQVVRMDLMDTVGKKKKFERELTPSESLCCVYPEREFVLRDNLCWEIIYASREGMLGKNLCWDRCYAEREVMLWERLCWQKRLNRASCSNTSTYSRRSAEELTVIVRFY